MNHSRLNKSTCGYSPIQSTSNGVGKNSEPRLTSTPLPSLSGGQNRNSLLYTSPKMRTTLPTRRYSLSEASTSTPVSRHSQTRIQAISGPLLASTRFNVNLCTYMDSKSPGLTSRIVQYNNERKEERMPTHQVKYGSPGLFPVVHFFKQSVPVISPRRVTVRIATPDKSTYTAQEQNRILLDNMTHDLSMSKQQDTVDTDISTKSVLDALKEISRKRLHGGSDYEEEEEEDANKKRQRTEQLSGPAGDTNKRLREESPPQQFPTAADVPNIKRVCVVDPVMASFSSSRLYQERLELGLKRKAVLEFQNIAEKELKQQKLMNVETQTAVEEQNKEPMETFVPKVVPKKVVEEKRKEPKASLNTNKSIDDSKVTEQAIPILSKRIFNEEQLEINRRNKLALLLGAITGEKPTLLPHRKSSLMKNEIKSLEKLEKAESDKPKSILSPHNKPKHDKHVSFNIPTTTTPDENNKKSEEESIQFSPANNSTSITTSTETPKKETSSPSTKIVFGNASPNSIKIPQPPAVTSVTTSLISPISFGGNTSKTATVSSPATTQVSFDSQTKTTPPALSFGQNNLNVQTNDKIFSKPATSSPSSKPGGFKFDFDKSSSTSSKSETQTTSNRTASVTSSANSTFNATSPNFTFNGPSNTGMFELKLNKPSNAATPNTSDPTNSNQSQTKSNVVSNSFTNQLNTSAFNSSSSTSDPPKSLGMFAATTTQSTLSFGVATTTTASKFGTGTGNPIVSFGVASDSSTFSFGDNKNSTFGNIPQTTPPAAAAAAPSSAVSAFDSKNSTLPSTFVSSNKNTFNTAITTASTFGTETTAAVTFGVNTTTSSIFGKTSNASSVFGFGTSTSTSSSAFGSNVSTGFGSTFGAASTTTAPTFGGNTAASGFGTGNTQSFGTNNPSNAASTFGSTNNVSAFGSNTTQASPFNSNTTQRPQFGSNTEQASGFGTSAAKVSFGINTTQASTFGTNTTKASAFGTSTTQGFGITTTQAPTFGTSSSQASSFGTNTTQASGFVTTTTQSSGFGTNTTQSSAFGKSTTQSSAFGTNTTQASGFGKNTPQTSGFGTNAKQTSGFGASTATPAFGAGNTQGSVFGANNPSLPAFGTTTAAPSFGTGTVPTNSFGSGFGPVTTTPSGFGTNSGSSFVFGTKTAVNTFGAPNNAGGAFGAGNNTPSFGFGTATTQVSTFGSTPAATFGAATTTTASNMFGSTNTTPGFVSNSSSLGTTSALPFGTGGFGSNNANTFGGSTGGTFNNSSNQSAFGTVGTGDSGFGKQPGNMFGSGGTNQNFSANTNQPSFNNNNAFGTPSAVQPSGSGFGSFNNAAAAAAPSVFAFGASTNPAAATQPTAGGGVFAFGSDKSKPAQFSFPSVSSAGTGFGTTNTPAFGTNAAVPFGGNNSTAFNNTPAPQFNASGTGMFSIGTGAASSRPRQQLKAKRRTQI